MIKSINNKTYQVLPEEFVVVEHPTYNNLKIIPEVGEMERIVSLLRELSAAFKIKSVVTNCPTHGGFIPIQLSSTVETVYISVLENNQIENTLFNIKDISNIFIYNNIMPLYSTILYFQSPNHTEEDHDNVLLSPKQPQQTTQNHIYKLTRSDFWLSIPTKFHPQFLEHFHYFIQPDNQLDYDNLIDLCIMVRNAGDQFEQTLLENFSLIDKWTILDTGSTDNTIDIINRVLKGKKPGNLYQEPFVDFPTSRNRCLELAGQTCKYTLMLDDTYRCRGHLREFLQTVRGDQFASSYSMYVLSDDVQYTSNRIVKTENRLRYIFKLHEIINPANNINVNIPNEVANIYDYRCDYMEERTMERKRYDIQVLEEGLREEPDNPRNLYYLAQTYNLLKQYDTAFDYFMKRVNHLNTGFIQEKHDAYFEAGRIANFQLNKPWEECKSLYEKAYELDPKRPESQYFLGIHYYLEGDLKTAWSYFVKAYEIGYPIHCEFSLKPTLSFFFLPKFLAELCYTYAKNYSFGKEVAEFFLKNNKPFDAKRNPIVEYNTMLQWYSIFSLLEKTKPTKIPEKEGDLPILTFVADSNPAFGKWTGRDILSKGMGGSETYIIEMARWIQRSGQFRVIVFCRCDEMDVFENVMYLPINSYTEFISKTQVYSTVISRFLEYVPCSLIGHVENVYVVLHDLVPDGAILPLDKKIKRVFCLSEWHVEHFLGKFPQFKDRTMAFYYGVSMPDEEPVAKQPYKFIYSSYPNRGLLPLLQMWSRIVEREPRATLYIYSNVDGEWVNQIAKEEMDEIRRLLKETKNVIYEGWVSKEVLLRSWKSADVWFYPTGFLETFCLTALECAITRTLAITMNMGSLKNTVADRGVLLEGNPYDPEWQKGAIHTLFETIEHREKKEELVERNYEWAKTLSWENQANQLIPLLFGDNQIHYGSL